MRFTADGGIERSQLRTSLKDWLKDDTENSYTCDRLDKEAAFRESVAFGLRNLSEGVDLAFLSERHGAVISDVLKRAVQKLLENGWLQEKESRLLVTESGVLFHDAVMREILCS